MKRTLCITLLAGLFVMFASCSFDDGKLPISTKSKQARFYYLTGRDLNEKLRGQEAIQYFQQAVETDPEFAIAWMNLAFVTPTAIDFFKYFEKAKSLSDKVSEGERLWINAVDDGVMGI